MSGLILLKLAKFFISLSIAAFKLNSVARDYATGSSVYNTFRIQMVTLGVSCEDITAARLQQ